MASNRKRAQNRAARRGKTQESKPQARYMSQEAQQSKEIQLRDHKKLVEDWHGYFSANNARYWEFMNFVGASNLSDSDIAALQVLQKPAIEFNVLEAMISRLRADFAKQEPFFLVRAADGVPMEMLTEEFIKAEETVEGYLRGIFDDASNDGLQSNIHTDQLMGGFSAVYIHTDYVNEYSFEQNIYVDRAFDPTLTFFDPMARTSHKGDGEYCGMLIPYTKDRFIAEFGAEAAKEISFRTAGNIGGFNWCYEANGQEIILVAYMFKKQYKKKRIVKLSNGHVVTMKNYKELLEIWDSIEQPPIILDERVVNCETIVLHQFCETKELYSAETDYKYLPIVFVDGNSILVNGQPGAGSSSTGSASASGTIGQMTRPYAYQAKGAQKAKNFAGQSQLAAIENLTQAQLKVPLEAIPLDQLQAYQNPQQANVLIYNQFGKNGERLDPPQEVIKQQIPSIIENVFMMMDQTIQATLGSYDAQQGIVGNQISGKAIMQGAIQSDGAAGPYLINYIKAWNRIGEIVIDLIPKYYKTARNLPIIGRDGKRDFAMVNTGEEGDINLDYEAHTLQIKVEAGVNSGVQKQLALDTLTRMMAASPAFADFINTECLDDIVDNLDIRNIDSIKLKATRYQEKLRQMQEEQQQLAAQQAQQPSEIEVVQQIEMAKVEQRAVEAEGKLVLKAAELAIDQEEADLDYLKFITETEQANRDAALQERKVDAEDARSAIDLAIEVAELAHEKRDDD